MSTRVSAMPASASSATPPRVRKINADDLSWALAEGWTDFNAKRGDLIFVALLYPLIGLLTAAFAMNDAALPLFFPLVAGLSILGPAVASGFYELARRREEHLESSWWHFFDPLRGGNGHDDRHADRRPRAAVHSLARRLLCDLCRNDGTGFPGRHRRLHIPCFRHARGLGPDRARQFWRDWVFAVIVLVTTLISFPMAVDRTVDPGTAVATSLRAVQANPGIVAGWGLRVAGLLALGCFPAFIGLAVVLPVLGYATWHLYTRMVVRG